MTILLSENEDAGHWIWYRSNRTDIPITEVHIDNGQFWTDKTIYPADNIHDNIEGILGFCYPNVLSSIATGEIPTYIPLFGGAVENGADAEKHCPLFINEGRSNSGVSIVHRGGRRTARPSSGHPGAVNVAYCDRAVRPLTDDMDKTLLVRLCRPGDGMILNPKDMDF